MTTAASTLIRMETLRWMSNEARGPNLTPMGSCAAKHHNHCGRAFWTVLAEVELGLTMRGLELMADERQIAAFEGPFLTARTGVAFEF